MQSRQDVSFEIRDELAPVLFGAETWKKAFYAKDEPPGGFAGALARDIRLAKLYVGLSAMDKDAAAALLAGTDLEDAGRQIRGSAGSAILAALALHQTHAAVPGGLPAESIWEKMAGASPARPGPFFRALLEKDDGKLLSFYATLAQLDLAHQQFFTRNASRTSKFYELYRQSPEVARGAGKESLRDIVLRRPAGGAARYGRQRACFPGSPEALAGGQGPGELGGAQREDAEEGGESRGAGRGRRDSVAPGAHPYKATQSELDNFLAVVRIDAHRSEPLDEASALLLADHYPRSQAIYPYFASLSVVRPRGLRELLHHGRETGRPADA